MRERIAADMKAALRENQKTRLSTLRLLTAAIKDRDIAARTEDGANGASDAAILELLAKMIKQREESARSYEEAGRLELADRERAEIGIIREYLPRPMSETEISDAVSATIQEIGAGGIRDMGRVMAALKQRYAGRMDFGVAGGRVKAALT